MNVTNMDRHWRLIYDRFAPVLALLCLLIAVIAAAGTFINERNDRERDRAMDRANAERLTAQAELLGCFDEFATTLAGGLPLVREASAARNKAITVALAQLETVLTKILDQTAKAEDFAALVKALAAYRAADAELLEVQAENPYPDAPSEFCGAIDKAS